MRFPTFIAQRYLFAKKSNNIINWISGISVGVIAIVTAAIIIILSAMNGLSNSVMDLYSNFDPDFKIEPKTGKFFQPNPEIISKLNEVEGVSFLVETVDETVLLKYKDNQEVATVKGVSDQFAPMTTIDDFIIDGHFTLLGGGRQMCVIGSELAIKLGINTAIPEPLGIYIPDLESNYMMTGNYFKSIYPKPVGVFDINTDFNNKYVLITKGFAQELLDIGTQISAYEIGISDSADEESVRENLQEIVGMDFSIKSRFEQNEFLFKSINTEKWMTLLILSLIVILAIFNVIGALTMLIIDKKKDIFILQSMGATLKQIKGVFWLEGLLIAIFGAAIGSVIGIAACVLQHHFCFFGYGTAGRVECFPVILDFMDVFIAVFLVLIIAGITTLAPILRIKEN
jgi:ABC-type lipoprotein release transport system permease subunit